MMSDLSLYPILTIIEHYIVGDGMLILASKFFMIALDWDD